MHLSLRLADVCAGMSSEHAAVGALLPVCIRAVESHGCQLTTGIGGVDAFLPAEAFAAAFGVDAQPTVGQLLYAVVQERLRGGEHLLVSCDAATFTTASLQPGHSVEMGSILPGQRVTVCASQREALSAAAARRPCSAACSRPLNTVQGRGQMQKCEGRGGEIVSRLTHSCGASCGRR